MAHAEQVKGVEAPVTPPAWLEQSRRQLEAIERLPAGWDSDQSPAPRADIVSAAARYLATLVNADARLTQPRIHPTRGGGVQFEWSAGSKYLEVEFTDPQTARFYFVDADAHEEHEAELAIGRSLDEALRLIRAVNDAT